MDTHIRIERKQYSTLSGAKKALPTVISATALGVSTANLATNRNRNKKEVEFRDRQLKTTDRLIDSLNKVDKTLKEHEEKLEEKDDRGRRGYKNFKFLPTFLDTKK